MINPIILSDTNEEEAMATFNIWLNDRYTLLLVTGTHPQVLHALETAHGLVNSGHAYYASVRIVHAPQPEFLVPNLRFLKVNPKLDKIDWARISNYAILSISNKYNNIAYIYSNEEIGSNTTGKINMLVLQAQAYDRPVNR